MAMARIVAGYIIEHEELVKMLKAQGRGPGPGEPELSIKEAMMTFISWRCAQPEPEDITKALPRPQYWYDKDDNEILAFMTRYSGENVNWQTLRYREMPKDIEIRDMFIAQTGNVLNPDKMRFWSSPETYLHLPLGTKLFLD